MDFCLTYQDDTEQVNAMKALDQHFSGVRVEIDEDELRIMSDLDVKVKRSSVSVRRFNRRYHELYRQYHGRHGVTEHTLRLFVAKEFGFLESL